MASIMFPVSGTDAIWRMKLCGESPIDLAGMPLDLLQAISAHNFACSMASALTSFRRSFSGVPTHAVLRAFDWLIERTLPPDKIAAHYKTGKRGEEAAYFYLRRLGYTMVARNFRSPRSRGEIDLIGWEAGTLCFIEVKTRTTRDVKPGEAAVDQYKRHMISRVAREYLRYFPPSCQWRFDVVSVYYDQSRASQPQIEIFRNSSLTA